MPRAQRPLSTKPYPGYAGIMLNEWSDREPDPPRSAWRDRIVMGLAGLTGIILLANIAQRFGLL